MVVDLDTTSYKDLVESVVEKVPYKVLGCDPSCVHVWNCEQLMGALVMHL